MKNIVVDSYDFPRIIQNGNIYVDKTDILYDLITSKASSRYFIARPRRFGKSLMLSTLEAIFSGRKELFGDCQISSRQYSWERYPVVHLDMSAVLGDNALELKSNLHNLVRRLAKREGLESEIPAGGTHSACFAAYLEAMFQKYGGRIVVLIDEYDAPVNCMIEKEDEVEAVRKILHDFYTQLKVYDSSICFLMMTGVSKFAKLSVFSGLNNLKDLTLEPEYAGLMGYTTDEIRHYFSEHISAFGEAVGRSSEVILATLLDWYDGYRFSPYSEIRVTNPVSLASALERHRFDPFWAETGQSNLIFKHLKDRQIVPEQLNGFIADKSDLDFCNLSDSESPALLFQTGYLTIDRALADNRIQFRIPNKEVAKSLTSGMMAYIFRNEKRRLKSGLDDARRRLEKTPSECETVLHETLTAAFNAVPYDWTVKDEPEARRMFLFYCVLMGADILGEVHSNKGRADAVLRFEDSAFVFEFKYNHTAQEALRQAETQNYGASFADGKRTVYLVGVNYNPEKRNIDPPCCKKILNP